MSDDFITWLTGNLSREDTPKNIREDPAHLKVVPLALSPLFNGDACEYLMGAYKKIGLIDERYDGSSEPIIWKGPTKVHVRGNIHGHIRAIYAKLSNIGIPYGYSAYNKLDSQLDINPMNLLVKPDQGANELRFEPHYFPFIPQNRSSPIGMFGTYSVPSIVNTMMLYGERDPVLRLQHLINLTTFYVTQGDTMKSATALITTKSVVYDTDREIRDRVAENSETTTLTQSELLVKCVEHVDEDRFASVMTKPFRVDGRVLRMHRIMWSAVFGNPDFSEKNTVRVCRNKNCLNPFHFKCE